MTIKLSQIPPAGAQPLLTDQLVGISGGNLDRLFSLAQVKLTVGGGGGGGGGALPNSVNIVTDFGADPTGGTDSTTAINNAYANFHGSTGVVIWPAGNYRVTNSILCGDISNGPVSFISTYAPAGPGATNLFWHGANNIPAFINSYNKYYFFWGLNISYQGASTPVSGSQGMVFSGPGNVVGTTNLAAVFYQVSISGFYTNLMSGGNFGTGSEILYLACNFYNAISVAFDQIDFNSLDHVFISPSLGGNAVGLQTGASENFTVYAGSSSINGIDFQIGGDNTIVNIMGHRSENVTNANVFGDNATGTVRVMGCDFRASTATAISGAFTSLTVDGCYIEGGIKFSQNPKLVTITSNQIKTYDTANNMPISFSSPLTNASTALKLICHNNLDLNFPAAALQEFDGMYGVSNIDNRGVLLFEPSVWRVQQPAQNNSPAIPNNPQLGVDYLVLSHVRQLSEATVPNAVGTPGGAASAPNPGQNLRIMGKFASSTTLNITFQRNVTVNNTPSGVQSAQLSSSAAFFPSDAGKPIFIAGRYLGSQDWHAYIVSYTNASTILTAPGPTQQAIGLGGTPATAVIGANEPDGNYMVLVQGVSGETYGVSSLSTTGFTVTSSNATSTATVTCLIIR